MQLMGDGDIIWRSDNDWDRILEADIVEGSCELINEKEVKEAIRNMKVGKTAGLSEIVVEMLKAAGNKGVKIMKLCNHIVRSHAKRMGTEYPYTYL